MLANMLTYVHVQKGYILYNFKKITDTSFYEVRIEINGNIYRLLGFFHNGSIVILTNGFQKKTQKTPKSEIEICKERMNDFLKRGDKK